MATDDSELALLKRVRDICFSFAATEEKLSHGSPFFHVRGKGFVTFGSDHHNAGGAAVWCKSTLDEQRRLVKRDPAVYFVPPYVGVKGWVGVRLEHPNTDFDALAMVVEEAWRSVVPKKLEGETPKAPAKEMEYPTTDAAVVKEAKDKLRTVCESLAESEVEEAAYGQVTWRVGGKPYAYLQDNIHRDGIVGVCFRVDADEADALVTKHPRSHYIPKYLAGRGWVGVRVDRAKVAWKSLEASVRASYLRVAPKRLQSPSNATVRS